MQDQLMMRALEKTSNIKSQSLAAPLAGRIQVRTGGITARTECGSEGITQSDNPCAQRPASWAAKPCILMLPVVVAWAFGLFVFANASFAQTTDNPELIKPSPAQTQPAT